MSVEVKQQPGGRWSVIVDGHERASVNCGSDEERKRAAYALAEDYRAAERRRGSQ